MPALGHRSEAWKGKGEEENGSKRRRAEKTEKEKGLHPTHNPHYPQQLLFSGRLSPLPSGVCKHCRRARVALSAVRSNAHLTSQTTAAVLR